MQFSYESNYRELEVKILNWARERDILKLATPQAQAKKTMEEVTELFIGVCNEDFDEIVDGIGDTLVTLIILAELCQIDLLYCLNCAYDEIKDRNGKMINGTFVKDT